MTQSFQQTAIELATCPRCSRRFPPSAKFCGIDGASLQPGKKADGQSIDPGEYDRREGLTRKCGACSELYKTYANFCTIDGLRLEDIQMAVHPQLIGSTIDGKYRIDSLIAEGGMAMVYKAFQGKMDRVVVVKVMLAWLTGNDVSRERFERECKLSARLNHPNIVSVYDVGMIDGRQPYLVMEYVSGQSLADRIHKRGKLSLREALMIAIQLCRGLQEAHSAGIVHRDLKPDNILLQEKSDRPDWVKILDFGIANPVEGSRKLTKTGRVIGTPEYMAPEQLKAVPIDTRVDIYAVGVIIFEMLAGQPPFSAETVEAILIKQLQEEAPLISSKRNDLEPGCRIDQILAMSLNKNPDDRQQTATEFRLALEGVLNEQSRARNKADSPEEGNN